MLLYWDEVGSIVPSEYVNRLERLGRYMAELVEVKLVRPVPPGNYIHEIPNFEEPFLELIRQNQIPERRSHALERGETFRIHIEKFGPLADELEYELGLARKVEDHGYLRWYDVERLTANLYMAYLASVLGKCRNLHMDPITDHSESLLVFSKSPQSTFDPTSLIDQLRMSVLEGVLPAPAGGIPVRELVDFKDRHSDILTQFRRYIEESLVEIALIDDRDLRNRKVRLVQDELREKIDEIQIQMQRKWPHTRRGTFCGLVTGAIPGVKTLTRVSPPKARASLGLTAAIHLAYRGDPDRRREILNSPLAYAALAQEQFG